MPTETTVWQDLKEIAQGTGEITKLAVEAARLTILVVADEIRLWWSRVQANAAKGGRGW